MVASRYLANTGAKRKVAATTDSAVATGSKASQATQRTTQPDAAGKKRSKPLQSKGLKSREVSEW